MFFTRIQPKAHLHHTFILIFAFIISSNVFAFIRSEDHCDNPYLFYNGEELLIRKSWDHLGFKLQSHDPLRFSYLVTMIDLKYMNFKIPSNSWAFKLLQNPERIIGNDYISASLISHTHLGTILKTRIGIILNVPCGLIGPMYPWNMSSGTNKNEGSLVYKSLHRQFPKTYSIEHFFFYALQSKLPFSWSGIKPQTLEKLDFVSSEHNEVKIIGSHGDRKVEVGGILVNCAHREGLELMIEKESLSERELNECLKGYHSINIVLPMLMKLSKKYQFFFKYTH